MSVRLGSYEVEICPIPKMGRRVARARDHPNILALDLDFMKMPHLPRFVIVAVAATWTVGTLLHRGPVGEGLGKDQ